MQRIKHKTMETTKTIEVLNNLIELNADRIEGYATASVETDDTSLKALFNKFKQTSEVCKSELISEVDRLGGETVEGTRISGKFFRAWMDVKAALTGNDKKLILESCEYGEDIIKHNYEKTLSDHSEDLTLEQESLIQGQYNLLKAEHDEVKTLRDTVPT
jgi:uncharacterized protein (TIGR02284 family)